MDIYELIKAKHSGQYRNEKGNGQKIPYTDHLYGVASIVKSALAVSQEITDEKELQDVVFAAFGHDLIEDTDVTEEEIIAAAGKKTLSYIKELSNPDDDAHTSRYMEQISKASEEARLVKYADLIENTLSVGYNLHIIEKDWLENIYIPILTNATDVLAKTEFVRYTKTAKQLRIWLNTSTNLLFARIRS